MVTVAGLFHVLIVLAEILGHVEWVVCIIHSAFVREPQPVALLAASRLELGFEFLIQGQGGASPVRHSGLGWSQVALTSLIRGSLIIVLYK